MPTNSRARVAIAAAVMTMFVTACLPPFGPWSGDGDGPLVAVVGDSLVHAAQFDGGNDPDDPDRFLDDELAAGGYRSTVSARIGADTADLARLEAPAEPADVVIVALGTNDLDRGVTVERAIANIVDFLDRLSPRCAAVVTVVVDAPDWGLDVTAPPYNAALADLGATRDDLVVADWATRSSSHPEWFAHDQVHHTEAGRAAYRQLVREAADECAARLDPTGPEPEPTEPGGP